MYEFSLTPNEVREAGRRQRLMYRRAMHPALWRVLVVLAGLAVTAAVTSAAASEYGFDANGLIPVAACTALVFYGAVVIERYLTSILVHLGARPARELAGEPCSVGLTAAGITLAARHRRAEWGWQHLVQAQNGRRVLFLALRGGAWVAVPLRMVEAPDALLARIKAWRAAAA